MDMLCQTRQTIFALMLLFGRAVLALLRHMVERFDQACRPFDNCFDLCCCHRLELYEQHPPFDSGAF